MNIIKLLKQKSQEPIKNKVPTIAFFGDSVTQGCFELFEKPERMLGNVCDEASAYHSRVKEILSFFFPDAPLNIINAGLAGDNATESLKRLSRDVFSYKPDLTVVCFGLNDSYFGMENLQNYIESLSVIFQELKKVGSEIIFMTPNMMCTVVSPNVYPAFAKGNAEGTMKIQNEGVFDRFLEEAKALCRTYEIPVCD